MSTSIIKSLAKQLKISITKVEGLWKSAEIQARKKGLSRGSSSYYIYIAGIIKNLVKLEHKYSLLPSKSVVELYLNSNPHKLRSVPRNSPSIVNKNKFPIKKPKKVNN